MTQEEKQLLLKDLCARLPYKTYIEIVDEDGNIRDEVELAVQDIITVRYDESTSIHPYLRSMSSMTEDEKEEYRNECNKVLSMPFKVNGPYPIVDWLNAHHFDHRGLIERGLAIEAPEGMYD